uniref:SAC domain-containing protein n=1 Tax=Amphimedon queenslandica TaxID=400682 RepID=A0A1X7TUT7_AMPQE
MLKIDRTQSGAAGLVVEEDEKEYQQNEVEEEREKVQETLTMLESTNQNFTTCYKGGLQQVAPAFGIVGFIRFLESYYIILITKRKPVANIGGHILYKIEDTAMHCLSAPTGRPAHPDESKYIKIFQNVDLSSSFYFSYSYDVTHSLQFQMRTSGGPMPPSCLRFIWNEYLLENLEGFVHSRWILHIICGFMSQISE